MRSFILACLTALTLPAILVAAPVHLRCDHLDNPLGIDSPHPVFSWQSDNTEPNWSQSAFEIWVATKPDLLLLGHADIWDSGKQLSSESVGILYGGPKLAAKTRYYWTVRVWDAAGKPSTLAQPAVWETGLLTNRNWTAKWIARGNPGEAADRAAMHWIWLPGQDPLSAVPKTTAVFRSSFDARPAVQNAALILIARGAVTFQVNGRDAGGKAHWDDFDWQDISAYLVTGRNTIEVTITVPTPPPGQTPKAALAALVKLSGADGAIARTGTDASWQSRLASETDWKPAQVVANLDDAKFGPAGPLPQPAALFRRTFGISKRVQSARLYATAMGSYRFTINGRPVSKFVLTPEFTDYRRRVTYQTHNVTGLVKAGENVIGAMLGDGWFASPLTWNGSRFYSGPIRLLAQLEIQYIDGSSDTIVTDGSWTTAGSPILHSTIYAGETYDARLEQPGWDRPEFQGSGWTHASLAEAPSIPITAQVTPPVEIRETVAPKTVNPLPDGAWIFDMGQNMVGWVTLRVKGPAGTRVRLRFAEILNPDGTIYTQNLRAADATDLYTLRGAAPESFAPHFTFHGFRYVEVTGYPGKPDLSAITGDVVSSLTGPPSGKLVTSSDLVNKMWKIGIWGQLGNFLSIPTDCPQRDERLGWMGDAGVFWRTGSYNFDTASFTRKFELDVNDAQSSAGAFANTSPDLLDPNGMVGAPGWGDAGVIVPWNAWQQYGDRSYIRDNWSHMARWMDFIERANPNHLRKNGLGPNFADWLAPDDRSPSDLVATAYWGLLANMMAQMARATGNVDAVKYERLGDLIRQAYQEAYIKDDGEVAGGTQTAYLLTLYTGMAQNALQSAMVDKLVKDIDSRQGHLSTGFLGTPFLLFTLAEHGRADIAYKLLLNETYPSWGYMLSKGATTWWERWNGDTGDPSMNSYNHYAFGSVVAWVYREVAGIDTDPASPGFHRLIVHPRLDASLTSARGEYDSAYGKVISDWTSTPGKSFSLKLTIPANTTASVYLPAIPGASATKNGTSVKVQSTDGSYIVQVGSGTYDFEVLSALAQAVSKDPSTAKGAALAAQISTHLGQPRPDHTELPR